MNKIETTVRELKAQEEMLGLSVMKDSTANIIETMTDEAYKRGAVEFLVNCDDLDMKTIYLGDLKEGEDYRVITKVASYYYNGHTYEFNYMGEYMDFIDEHEIENPHNWHDIAIEPEIHWLYFYNFYGDVELEVANRLGLPVIELKNGDRYVSIKGCGMDLTHQIILYQALAHEEIDTYYATSKYLNSVKERIGKVKYKSMLTTLGVDIDRLEEFKGDNADEENDK